MTPIYAENLLNLVWWGVSWRLVRSPICAKSGPASCAPEFSMLMREDHLKLQQLWWLAVTDLQSVCNLRCCNLLVLSLHLGQVCDVTSYSSSVWPAILLDILFYTNIFPHFCSTLTHCLPAWVTLYSFGILTSTNEKSSSFSSLAYLHSDVKFVACEKADQQYRNICVLYGEDSTAFMCLLLLLLLSVLQHMSPSWQSFLQFLDIVGILMETNKAVNHRNEASMGDFEDWLYQCLFYFEVRITKLQSRSDQVLFSWLRFCCDWGSDWHVQGFWRTLSCAKTLNFHLKALDFSIFVVHVL